MDANGRIPLEAWGNLFLVTSAAASTLVGLLFVVITLAADRQPTSEVKRIHLYLTPTVVYFASVLVLAALLTFPTHSRFSATACCCGEGVFGIVYALSLLRTGLGANRFRERSDALQYSLLPAAAYGLLVAGGATLHGPEAERGLTIVAIAMLALVTLALRNSWSIAVSVVSTAGK